MQTIFYIIILILSLVSSFKICGLLKVMIWGENTLDLGMKILSFWAMICKRQLYPTYPNGIKSAKITSV